MREVLFGQDVTVLTIIELFVYMTPFFLLLLMPISTMLSVFMTFLRMSTDQELTALRAGGTSLYQLLPAPLTFCVLSMTLCYYIAFVGLGWGMDQFRDKLFNLAKEQTKIGMQAGVFNTQIPGITFFANNVDVEDGKLRSVFVQDKSNEKVIVNIVAPEARIIADKQEAALKFVFNNGKIYRREAGKLDVLQFGSYTIGLPLESIFGSLAAKEKRASQMSWAEMQKDLERRKEAKIMDERDSHKLLVEMQKRLSLPFSCFVLGLFALPVACVFRGLKQQYGFMLSVGLFIVYYTLFSIGVALGEGGAADPVQALWGPNVLFLTVALYGLHIASREKNMHLVQWFMHLKSRKAQA